MMDLDGKTSILYLHVPTLDPQFRKSNTLLLVFMLIIC